MALPPSFLAVLRSQAGSGAEYPDDATPSLLAGASADGDAEGESSESFDFVVVGAGAAGAAVAARLAAHRPDWKVLVMEAGGDAPIEAEVPGLWFRLWTEQLIWTYRSEPREDAFQVRAASSVRRHSIYLTKLRNCRDKGVVMTQFCQNPGTIMSGGVCGVRY